MIQFQKHTPKLALGMPQSLAALAANVSLKSLAQLRSLALSLLGGSLCALIASPALAQSTTPSSGAKPPLRLVVPFTPGTGIDIVARQVGPRLAERLGRPVVIDNKAGASGNIGTEIVVRSPPDGSTLLVTVNTLVMNRSLYAKMSFDPLKDLEPIVLTSWGQLVLVASKQSGIQSAADFIAKAKAQPGKINYGSPGNGTPHHLAMELVKNKAKIFTTHIPYSGTGPALTDLLGGQIDIMFLPIHVALAHVKAGKLQALAISSDTSSPLLPEVPPLKSLKLGDLNVEMWFGIMGPKGIPKDMIDRLNQEIKAILALPEVKVAFESQGMTPSYSTAAEFRALVEKDAERWAQVVKAQNIKAD